MKLRTSVTFKKKQQIFVDALKLSKRISILFSPSPIFVAYDSFLIKKILSKLTRQLTKEGKNEKSSKIKKKESKMSVFSSVNVHKNLIKFWIWKKNFFIFFPLEGLKRAKVWHKQRMLIQSFNLRTAIHLHSN